MSRTRVVLFDLDDTLFDHAFAARRALGGIHGDLPRFAKEPFDALEREYSELLEEVHLRVLAGEMNLEEARLDRMKNLLSGEPGKTPTDEEAKRLAALFRDGYQRNRRVTDGARELLEGLRASGVAVGIVTNNMTEEQRGKLAFLGLDALVDFMVTSEEVGPPKPGKEIFEAALTMAKRRASEAVVVGDSWGSDVVGAKNAGIRAVWYNPRELPKPGDPPATELRSFRPAGSAIEEILA